MRNMTVKDLRKILNECPDDMPVIIPVINIEDSNDIQAFRYVRTAGILYDDYMPEAEQHVICLNSSEDSAVISDQLGSRDVVCERVLYPNKRKKKKSDLIMPMSYAMKRLLRLL